MRKIKLTLFLILTFFSLNCFVAFANELKNNNINIRKLTSDSVDLYHEKDSVVEVMNYNSKKIYLSEDDIYLMSQIVYAESKGQYFLMTWQKKIRVNNIFCRRKV